MPRLKLAPAQYRDPVGDIRRVVFSSLGRQFKAGGEGGGAKLGDKLLHRVAFVAEALAPEIAIKARWVPRPVREFMRERGVIGLGVAERLDVRHAQKVL